MKNKYKSKKMEKLSKDLIEKISNEFTPEELIIFCDSGNKNLAIKKMCDSKDFWFRRLKKDYDFLLDYFLNLGNKNYKNIYLNFFSKLSEGAEKITNEVLNAYGPSKNYLSFEYKKKIYDYFYNFFLNFIKSILIKYKENFNIDIVSHYISNIDYVGFYEYLPELMTERNEYWEELFYDEIFSFMEKLVDFLEIKNYLSNFPD